MSTEEIRTALAELCRQAGSQAAWAALNDISAAYVSDVLRGRRPAGGKILTAMGIKLKTIIVGVGRPRVADPVGKRMSYRSWNQIIQRCTNPNNPGYKNYGGRGITVCERWLKYSNFVVDMGEPPVGYKIERKDNGAGYSPDNCIWADQTTQCRNRRNTKYVEINGKRIAAIAACEQHGLDIRTLRAVVQRDQSDWSEAFRLLLAKKRYADSLGRGDVADGRTPKAKRKAKR